MGIEHHGLTDVGQKRTHNEDSFLVNADLGLFVVADGMGGHAGGGTASRIAVEVIEQILLKRREQEGSPFDVDEPVERSPLAPLLREAVESASTSIYEHARRDLGLAGMGTTVTALLLHGGYAFIGHVGDSRAYVFRGGFIDQLTEDHSVVNEQLRAGLITEDEARNSKYKNIITRSVGFEERVLVDVMALAVEDGDTFILCSDGLTNNVEDEELAEKATLAVEEIPPSLIQLANDRGGDDNITVIAVRV